MEKYQFYISFNDKKNTASVKAIDDCTFLLTQLGYQDYNLVEEVTNQKYLFNIVVAAIKFVFKIKAKSIVAIQYPLLSGNTLFKYIIALLRYKKVKVFCIIHDLNELRYPALQLKKSQEAELLNSYDGIIVHNGQMKKWLLERGVKVPMISLEIFDYLSDQPLIPVKPGEEPYNKIVFAGNLSKSGFIYQLENVSKWQFNLYGPNFLETKLQQAKNVRWKGSFSPEEILTALRGNFGLIWDGERIDQLDEVYGNYLRYNNPHKLSLYLAAGLPVIAPRHSAIGDFVKKHQLGFLIDQLEDLNTIDVAKDNYLNYQENVLAIGTKLRTGTFLTGAISRMELQMGCFALNA